MGGGRAFYQRHIGSPEIRYIRSEEILRDAAIAMYTPSHSSKIMSSSQKQGHPRVTRSLENDLRTAIERRNLGFIIRR